MRIRRHGIDIVRKAIQTPARQIAINAGDDGSIVVGKIMEKDQYSFGFDAQSGEYGNLVSKGIIDPTKVVRCALQDAAAVAGLLITTEAMVAELPKKELRCRQCRVVAWVGWTTNALANRRKSEARDFPGPFVFFAAAFSSGYECLRG